MTDTSSEEDADATLWRARFTQQMIAAIPQLATVPSNHKLNIAATAVIKGRQRVASHRWKDLAQLTGVAERLLVGWHAQHFRPTYPMFMRLCHAPDLFPDVLLGMVAEGSFNPPKSRTPQHAHRSVPANIAIYLREVITSEETPPPSLRAVARRLGYTHRTLCLYAPELCAIVVRQHRQWMIEQSAHHELDIRQSVRDGIYKLQELGAPLTASMFRKHIDRLLLDNLVAREEFHQFVERLWNEEAFQQLNISARSTEIV